MKGTDLDSATVSVTARGPRGANLVIVLGMATRSGTNFVRDLLCVHPECTGCRLSEVGFVGHSDRLIDFGQSLHDAWGVRDWGQRFIREMQQRECDALDVLCESIGHGLERFLWRTTLDHRVGEKEPTDVEKIAGKRLIVKAPSVKRFSNVFRFFPEARVLILVRDGRSIVHSQIKSFDRRFESAVRGWDLAARTILDPSNETALSNCLLVRYEDLFTKTRAEMSKVLRFLELDDGVYDFEKAENLPVRGSSQSREESGDLVWQQQSRESLQFDPLKRWGDWSRYRHERFNWLAGDRMHRFGYDLEGGPAYSRVGWAALNVAMDVLWHTVLNPARHLRNWIRASRSKRS